MKVYLLVVALGVALLAACDSGKPSDKAPVQDSPPSVSPKPAAPEPTESRHLVDLGSREYPAAKTPPVEAVGVRFDFSAKRVYAFDYHQRVNNTTGLGMPNAPDSMGQTLTADGVLLMKSKSGGMGTLVLKDMKGAMSMSGGPPGTDKTMAMPMPTMVVPDVKEDGGMEGGAASTQPLLKMLFPMPTKPMLKGEVSEIPLSIPFNVMGSPLTVKGTGRITLAGFVTIEERICARLDVDVDVSKLDIPSEIETKASCSMKGRSVYYWDIERKEYVSGESAILMKMKMEGAAPKLPEGAPPMPSTLKMSMVSDNLIRITRNVELAVREIEGK